MIVSLLGETLEIALKQPNKRELTFPNKSRRCLRRLSVSKKRTGY